MRDAFFSPVCYLLHTTTSPSNTMATTQRHKRVVLVGPEGALRCDAPEEIRFWTLPHPRSHAPAYYLPYHRSHDPSSSTKPDGVLELQTLKSERTPQSWFLAPPVDQHLSVQHDRLTSSRRRTFIRPGSEQNSVLKGMFARLSSQSFRCTKDGPC